jgi:hypothetical protein
MEAGAVRLTNTATEKPRIKVAGLQLFVPSHLQEFAAFLRKAYRLRFPRNGSLRLTAQVQQTAGGDGDVDTDDGSTSGDDDSDDD